MSSDSSSHFDLVPMTGPAAQVVEMVTLSSVPALPLPDVSELPDVTKANKTKQIPAKGEIQETVEQIPTSPCGSAQFGSMVKA